MLFGRPYPKGDGVARVCYCLFERVTLGGKAGKRWYTNAPFMDHIKPL